MRAFNYELRKVPPQLEEIKRTTLDKAEENARRGLVQARLELRHHQLLLDEAPELERTEEEIKGYKTAVERDEKSINNWETQIRAINYERENN